MNPNFSNFAPLAGENQTGRKTLMWFRVYCAVLCVIYLLVAALGVFLVVFTPQNAAHDATETFIVGGVYLVFGVILCLIFAVGLMMPPRRWSWIYGIVLIAIGTTSCCFAPATIPLLIFWLKPETKSLFGR